MSIDDALHYTEEERQEIIKGYPLHEREARIKGIPAMGSGRVYPVTEESILVEAFDIPSHWYRIAALDFGWHHPTAAVELAHDRDADALYVVKCYARTEATPVEHSVTLRAWGLDLPWAWPHDAYARDKRDGGTFRDDYIATGLNMLGAHATHPTGGNSVEAGVQQIMQLMQTGRFKVFSHLREWLDEFRMYHRKDGQIVKERDDIMDATRYAVMMLRFAEPRYDEMEAEDERYGSHSHAEMGAGGY